MICLNPSSWYTVSRTIATGVESFGFAIRVPFVWCVTSGGTVFQLGLEKLRGRSNVRVVKAGYLAQLHICNTFGEFEKILARRTDIFECAMTAPNDRPQ